MCVITGAECLHWRWNRTGVTRCGSGPVLIRSGAAGEGRLRRLREVEATASSTARTT